MNGWNDIIKIVHSWDKKIRSRVMQRSNPAQKKIIEALETVEPNTLSAWTLVESKDFKRLLQGALEYQERNRKKAEVKI